MATDFDDLDRLRPRTDSVGRGVGLGLAIHLLGQPLLLLAIWAFGELQQPRDQYFGILYILCVANIGLTQLPYVVPTALVLWGKRLRATLKGFMIVAGILLVINGTCFAITAAG